MSMTDVADELEQRRVVDAWAYRARNLGVGAVEDDPEKAAESIRLAQSTGTPPAAILADYDEFKLAQKRKTTEELLATSPALQAYINSHPLAASISNDDFDRLDEAGEKSRRIGAMGNMMGAYLRPERAVREGVSAFREGLAAGAVEGFGDKPWGWQWLKPEDYDKYPLASSVAAAALMVPEAIFRPLSAGIKGLQEGALKGVSRTALELGLPQSSADRLGREAAGLIEWATTQPPGGTAVHAMPRLKPEVSRARELAEPWLERGESPPAGLHPFLDRLKAEQSRADLKDLREAESAATATRERAPDLYEQFQAQQTDVVIGVDAAAVRALYGDKPPVAGDGLLGYLPDLEAQLRQAEAYGGDVYIPLPKWLAHTDPEVMKQLQDWVKVGREGLSKEEMALEKAEPQPMPPALDGFEREVGAIRHLAQLDRFAEQKALKLERKLPEKITNFGPAQGFHDFEMLDETGKAVGYINVSLQRGGKDVYIDMIEATGGLKPQDLGPRLLRDLLIRQIGEAFPEAERVGGYRVSGAREKAGGKYADMWLPLRGRKALETPIEQLAQLFGLDEFAAAEMPGMRDVGLGTKVRDVNEAALPEIAQKLVASVDELIARIAPTVRAEPVAEILTDQGKAKALYTMYKEAEPVIRWVLDGDDPKGSARHEAIHHLRRYGFFNEQEWNVLSRAARDGGWIEKHGIEGRYSKLDNAGKLEESIAEEYRVWAKDPARYKGPAATIFERLKELLDYVRKTLSEFFERDVTADEIFAAVEKGFVGERRGTKPRVEGAYDTQRMQVDDDMAGYDRVNQPAAPQEGGPTRAPPFATARAFGSNEVNAKRYGQLIAKRNAEDYAKALERAERKEKREQTAEWKENAAQMREEVAQDLTRRPDIAALDLLRDQRWMGERLDHAVKIDPETLPLDLREVVPKEFLAEGGMAADSLGQMFGYPDGRSLANSLIGVEVDRKLAGMSYTKWKDAQISAETNRRMQVAYGDLKENILDAARDQALSETQMELLHEETLAAAANAGLEFPLTREQMLKAWRDQFEETSAQGLKARTYLEAAGKAGRRIEDGLLAGKPLDAFKAKQQQYAATVLAKEATQWEKDQVRLDRLIKRFSPHHVAGIDAQHATWAQWLLQRSGVGIRRSSADIAQGIAHFDEGTFDGFVRSVWNDGGELYVSPELQRGDIKLYSEMTVGERRELLKTLQSLQHSGRETQKITIAGEKADLERVRQEIKDNIQQLPLIKPHKRWGLGRFIEGFDAALTRPEEILKDLDLRQEMGPLFKYVVSPMMDAKATEYDLLNGLVGKLKAIQGDFKGPWMKSLEDTIPQTLLRDPADGVPFDMKRENLVQIMLNWGTASSRDKFVAGWGRPPGYKGKLTREQRATVEAAVTDLINRHATKQDWDYVQRVWDIFDTWKPEVDRLYRNLSGTAPKWLPNERIATQFGEIDGKYFPIIYDRDYGNAANKAAGDAPDTGRFKQDYYRATTGNGYTVERTGYVDNIQFMRPLETVASRMQQVIHDLAFREAVINTGKIVYDDGIRNAIRRHYGPEYVTQLQGWLKRVANETNLNERELGMVYGFMRRMRLNLIGHTLPFNLKVLLSPDLGTANPKSIANFARDREANTKFVLENSREVQHMVYNMDRDFREHLERTIAGKGLDSYRRKAIEWGFAGVTKVSQQFRMATWLAEYKDQIAKGRSHYDASHLADSVVRERHSAASLVDLPSIMASNEAVKAFTMFYGYFNTMYNWQRQIPGNIRRGEYGKGMAAAWGTVGIGSIFGATLFNKQTEKDGWFKIISKAVGLQLVQGLPMARDAATYWVEGFSPRTAYAGAAVAIQAFVNDVNKAISGKKVEKPIAHTANVVGITTGLPLAQVGRTGEFLNDVRTNQQHPRNILEWGRGIITGEARLPKK